jgi:hypothetical protein
MKDEEQPAVDRPADPSARYRHLPEPIDLDATIASQETDPAPDPEGGRNTEHDFMLRYGAG